MRQPPVTTRLTIMLLYLTALVWQCFGLLAIFNMIPTIPAGPVRWIIGFLAIGCSIILTGITYFLNGITIGIQWNGRPDGFDHHCIVLG